jgi:hypothetical protein
MAKGEKVTLVELLRRKVKDSGLGGIPRVKVLVEPDALTVEDNGSGLPADVLLRTLDFSSRTSSKAGYVAPTRGQLGNALQTCYAAPFVVDGQEGRVDVAADGVLHRITVRLNHITQRPELDRSEEPSSVTVGTKFKLHWPGIACLLNGPEQLDSYRAGAGDDEDEEDDEDVPPATTASQLLRAYATFNPHVSFHLNGEKFPVSDPDWEKWRPFDPTSPHWYTAEDLRDLIAAKLADLIAGKLPRPSRTSRQAERRGVYLRLRDEASQDRQATIDSLRREIPADGVEDILVDGKSWDRIG